MGAEYGWAAGARTPQPTFEGFHPPRPARSPTVKPRTTPLCGRKLTHNPIVGGHGGPQRPPGYRQGVTRHSIGRLDDYTDGQAVARDIDGLGVVVWRDGGTVCVVRNHCPHLGLSLTKGPGGLHAEDGQITCPWHSSRFDMCSGENLDWVVGFAGRSMPGWSQKLVSMGRQPSPLTTYSVIADGDELYVDL